MCQSTSQISRNAGRNRRTCQKNHSISTRSRANVASNESTSDEELRRRFKNEIGPIKKKAEQALVGALVKYHHRRAERLRNKLRKLEQYKSRRNRNTVTKQTSHQKTQSPARKKTVNKDDNVNELAEELKTKIGEVDVLLEQMRSQVCANKQSESYSCLLSDSLEVRGKGKANRKDNKAAKTAREKSGEKSKTKSAFVTPLSHANSTSKTCQMNN